MATIGNLIRVGNVSDIDASRLAVRVVMPDRDDLVSGWLPLCRPPLRYDEYTALVMPEVGEQVLCLFLGNGLEAGFWLGTIVRGGGSS